MARKPSDLVALSLRIRERLRERLEDQAKITGVSLNAEIATRLERSFDAEKNYEVFKILLGGGKNFQLVRALCTLLSMTGDEWTKDQQLAMHVFETFGEVLRQIRGDAPKEPAPKSITNYSPSELARMIASFEHVFSNEGEVKS